jgi:hypothetical protein
MGGTVGYVAAGGSNVYATPSLAYSPPIAPNATPVSPTFDPKLDANALYGKPMALSALGYARIGGSPAPIVGPYIHDGVVDFVVSFGVPANVYGNRKIYKIYLDNELAWSSTSGGTLPGDGTFMSEPFDFVFKPGRLDQTVCSLETMKFPGDENAYRPQMLLQITGIHYQRFMDVTGKPVPYVAVDIGDVTDGAVPLDGINLGEALERVAYSPWAGYTASTFESVGITDVVDAILIKDNFTVIQLCQNVTREYRNIDLLLSDKVRVKDRGSNVSPDILFDRDSIISGDQSLVVTRAGATEQRRELELIAIDPDQDYTAVPSLAKIPRDPMVISAAVGKNTVTIPLVIDASTRQVLATFSQAYEENARRKVAFKVPVSGYALEPGDLFALSTIADGFDNEVFKCTQTSHGANWVVDVEAEAILRCSVYRDEFVGITWDPTTLANATISGDDLSVTNTSTAQETGVRGATDVAGKTAGKYYFEVTCTNLVGTIGWVVGFGVGTPTSTYTGMGLTGVSGAIVHVHNGGIFNQGANSGLPGPDDAVNGSVIGAAVDLDSRQIWFRTSPSGLWNGLIGAGTPESGTGGVALPAGVIVPFCTFGGFVLLAGTVGNVLTANFGSSTFAGAVPFGYTPGWPPNAP